MKWIAYNIGDPQDNNCIKVENSTVTHTSINITGKNNRIIVRNGAKMFFGGIKIIGNDNEVVYDGCKAMINVFMKGNGCKITVGRGSLIDESTSIVLMDRATVWKSVKSVCLQRRLRFGHQIPTLSQTCKAIH